MAVTNFDDLTNLGDIADGDKLLAERVDGTTVRVEFNNILQDGEFSSNGLMARTAAGTYANRTVTGTADKITVTNGDGVSGDPTLTIASTYVGQTSITTLGTIATGTWQGTTIAVDQGGSGQTSYTDGQLLIGNSTGNTLAKATITEGDGIDITNGSGTITIAAETASTTNPGIAELATTAEVSTGTDTGRVIPVSALPSQVQDSKYVYAADGEASDTYVITLTPAPSAYAAGQVFHFKANTANTGAATLNVNSLGAKTILKNGDQALGNNDIKSGQVVTVVYDGTQFQMQSQIGNTGGAGDMVLADTQTNTGAKTFNSGTLIHAGATSGTTTVNATAVAGTTTLTLPAATDTLVGKATTDTFTNKTFDANGTGNSLSNVDVADLANGTDGELITWDASGAPTTVGVGTANQVLTSNGAGAAPTFQDAGGGAWTYISSATASSSASITFTGLSSSYFAYAIYMSDVVPATDNVELWMRLSDDGGSTYEADTGDYQWQMSGSQGAGSQIQDGSTSDTKMVLTGNTSAVILGTGTEEQLSGRVVIYDPSTSQPTKITGELYWKNSGAQSTVATCGGIFAGTAAADAVQLLMSSGNIASGNFKLYGLTPS